MSEIARRCIREIAEATGRRQEGATSLDNSLSNADWDALFKYATLCELDAIVGRSIVRNSVRPPRWLRHTFRASYLYHTERNRRLLNEALKVQEALKQCSVPVMFRKGAHMASEYPDPGMRPFSDLDMMIRQKDSQNVAECLVSLGYQQLSNESHVPPSRETRLFYSLATTAMPPFFKHTDDAYLPFLSIDCAVRQQLPRAGVPFDFDGAYERRERSKSGLDVFGPQELGLDICASIHLTNTTVHYLRQGRHTRLIPYVDLLLFLTEGEDRLDQLVDQASDPAHTDVVAYALGNLARLFPRGDLEEASNAVLPRSVDPYLLDRVAPIESPPGLIWRRRLADRVFSLDLPEGLPLAEVLL